MALSDCCEAPIIMNDICRDCGEHCDDIKVETTDISTIEKEFLAFVVMPWGKSLGEHLIPELESIAKTGKMPKLLGM